MVSVLRLGRRWVVHEDADGALVATDLQGLTAADIANPRPTTPVALSTPDGVVRCPFCGRTHAHSGDAGLRNSDCSDFQARATYLVVPARKIPRPASRRRIT